MPRKMLETVLELSGGIFINPKILNRFENSSKLRKIEKRFKKSFSVYIWKIGLLNCTSSAPNFCTVSPYGAAVEKLGRRKFVSRTGG